MDFSITEWFIGLLFGVVGGILTLIPGIPALDSITGFMTPIFSYGASAGNFVPWGSLKNAIALVSAALGVAVLIRIGRIVASFFTAGGGSAG